MADAAGAISATSLTDLVLVLGALVAAYVVPLVLTKRKSAEDTERAALASWARLNSALQAEISRLQDDLSRQREDYQRQLDAARKDYQGQLDAARRRITELEAEVGALQRALRGGPVP